MKADIKRGAEKKALKFVQLHERERERESGEYSRLIGERTKYLTTWTVYESMELNNSRRCLDYVSEKHKHLG